MAVLTSLTEDDARALLSEYALGDLTRIEGIAAGSVNSNFMLESGAGHVFLRIYEERDLHGARSEAAMLERLARALIPTPAPLRRLDGALVSVVRGKPAALFPWKDGRMCCQAALTPNHTRRVGEELARMHLAGQGEPCDGGRFQLTDLLARVERIEASGDAGLKSIAPSLRDSLRRVQAARDPNLPHGLVHADLFRDNVLWTEHNEIAALLDFESACDGTYAYDLMVTVLSWCFGDDFDRQLAGAMREGYERVRKLTDGEKRALEVEGCFAALRFTVTRITDYAMRTGGVGARVVKDWRRFLTRFEKLQELRAEGVAALLGI